MLAGCGSVAAAMVEAACKLLSLTSSIEQSSEVGLRRYAHVTLLREAEV